MEETQNITDTTRQYYLKNIGIVDLQSNNWTWYVTGADRVAKITPYENQQPKNIGGEIASTLNDTLIASFYLYDLPITIGIGNTRIVYAAEIQCPTYAAYTIDYAGDYYPYGKTLREFVNGETEKFLTTQHERDVETGLDYRGARFYDSDISRFLSLDPLAADYPSLSDYSYVAGNPIIFVDTTGMSVESTDVRQNADGTYTVVGAANDGDKNIYVVDDDGNRTGETIGTTLQPYDFMSTDDKTGEFTFDKEIAGVTFSLDNLTVTGTVEPNEHTTATIYNADAQKLLDWGIALFKAELSRSGGNTAWGDLQVLKEMSANLAPLDFKTSLGLQAYTALSAGNTSDGKPIITTLRAIGNMTFGANIMVTKPEIYTNKFYYSLVMERVGEYNQSQNNGNGYNSGYPYFGEHTYSGSFIFYGYHGYFHW